MPFQLHAQATCDRCGRTAACEISLCPTSTHDLEGRSYWGMAAASRGLETWFQKRDGVACSPQCRDVLAKDPRWEGYSGDWVPCC
jgi:hypothetical protein